MIVGASGTPQTKAMTRMTTIEPNVCTSWNAFMAVALLFAR